MQHMYPDNIHINTPLYTIFYTPLWVYFLKNKDILFDTHELLLFIIQQEDIFNHELYITIFMRLQNNIIFRDEYIFIGNMLSN